MGWTRPRNRIAGRDGAGLVQRLGPGVDGLAVGDEVYGFLSGSFAESAIAPVKKLAPKPAGLGFAAAAALPIAATTAQRGIRDVAKARAGQRVLITGASGGVGHFAVQVAAALGAEVTGVCSAANAELVRELGATHVIDYRTTDFVAEPQRYDVILDNAGMRSPGLVHRALTPDGTLVMNDGGTPGGFFGPLGPMARGLLTNRFVRPTITTLPVREHRDELLDLNRLIAAGQLRPVVSRTWTLPEAAQALAELEQGHTRGKAVIEIA
jgi:NADPH:quinone reductase-like Zn-dependent oxidoreductase